MANCNGPDGGSKRPEKPFEDFPLYAHPLGYWSKKINGKLHHFRRWGRVVKGVVTKLPDAEFESEWRKALEELKLKHADIYSGRIRQTVITDDPIKSTTGLTIGDACQDFLRSKFLLHASGELTDRTFAEYRQTTDRLVKFFGKEREVDDLTPAEFDSLRADIAKTWGPVRLGNEVVRIRSVFSKARKSDVVPDTFKKPAKKVMRKHKAEGGKRLFTAAEVKQLHDKASIQLRAMILLGINCGFGNTDVADLPRSAIDLDKGWVDFARGKTGIERRVPLWPETVKAIRAAIVDCPKASKKADRTCVFLTPRGHRWVEEYVTKKTDDKGIESVHRVSQKNAVGSEFAKLLKSLKINGRRGLGFYSLRHTCATIGLETGERDVVKAIMGHVEGDMLANYNESAPSDARLTAVTNHVRNWVFAKGGAT